MKYKKFPRIALIVMCVLFITSNTGCQNYIGQEFVQSPPKISFSSINEKTMSLEILVNTFKVDVDDVFLKVWSMEADENGDASDDLFRYNAEYINGVWRAVVNLAQHKYSEGVYAVQSYINGEAYAFTFFVVPIQTKAKISLSPFDENTMSFKITVDTFNMDVGGVCLDVWSTKTDKDGDEQDDMLRYDAEHIDGKWRIVVNLAKHQYDEGLYIAQAYVNNTAYARTAFTVPEQANPKIQASHFDEKTQSINITVNSSKMAAKTVDIAFWELESGEREEEPEDLIWCKAELIHGTWRVTIDLKQHDCAAGIYAVHAYIDGNLYARTFFIIPI